MRRIFFILAFSFFILGNLSAQSYVIYTIVGHPSLVTEKGNQALMLRDKLTDNSVINIPYEAEIEMLDIENKEQIVIKTSGKGTIAKFLKNKKNFKSKLTKAYFNYILKKVKGDNETIVRTCIDPGITTRKQRTDSAFARKYQTQP